MFSSNELIHIVFVNENDTYYNCGLMRPDLNEHLWFKLHNQYSCVYFLSAEHGGCVKTFGDLSARQYEGDTQGKFTLKLTSKKNHDPLGTWMLKQLTAKQSEAAAFVCSLADFCGIFGGETHRGALFAMAAAEKRTGIIVLTVPATVEKSRRLLLESPVFEYLHETAVTSLRGGNLREMYTAIFKAKPNGCHFLNVITEDDAMGIMTCIAVEDMRLCPPYSALRDAAEYLSQYAINQELHHADGVLKLSRQGMLRRELYDQLKNENTRKKLLEKSEEMRACGGMREYLSRIGCAYVSPSSPTVRIYRDPDSLSGRCLALGVADNRKLPEYCVEAVSKILSEIKAEAICPKNRLENTEITKNALQFLSDAESALEQGDFETYRRALNAVRICMRWLYVTPGTPEEQCARQLADKLNILVSYSFDHFKSCRDLDISREVLVRGKVGKLTVSQLESRVAADHKLLLEYEDVVFAKHMKLSMQQVSYDNISDFVNELNDALDDVSSMIRNPDCSDIPAPADTGGKPVQSETECTPGETALDAESEPNTPPDTRWLYDDNDYSLSPSDYDYIPPDLHEVH